MAWKSAAATYSQLAPATEARYHDKRIKKPVNIIVGTLVLNKNYLVN